MTDIITSAHNPMVKQLRKLATSAKARREAGLAVAEGVHLVRSLAESDRDVSLLVCAESALQNSEVSQLVSDFSDVKTRQMVVKDGLFESFSSVHASVGVLAVFVSPVAENVPAELTENAVLLDDVQDPGNLGTMLRTAAAVGVRQVFLSPGCASAWSPKALRAGMGAQFGVTVYENVQLVELVKKLTIPTLVTTLSEKSQSLYELDLIGPAAWVFGSEGLGVSDELLKLATTHVSVPQENTAVESLNVAAATAVCLYEQYRQQRAN